MNNATTKSSKAGYRDRYRWILRKTIRSELEEQLWKHLLQDGNLDAYLDCLHLSRTIPATNGPKAVGVAKKAVDHCDLITKWFKIDRKFWKEQCHQFRGQPGPTAYREVLARLIVNLHGFWVFTLDDTNHTFRFVRAPADRDEWGAGPETASATHERKRDFRPAIHFGDHVYYKSGSEGHTNDLKSILESSLEDYLLRPGEGSVGLGLRADRGVCLRDTVRDLRGAVGLEDCITRNLSYIGLPIFQREADNESELGARGRPIGHFGIFFPAPVGWHAAQGSRAEWCEHCMFPCIGEKEHDSVCLFQKMLNLRQRIVQPLVAQNYQTLSDDRFKVRVAQIAGLGDDPDFQNRGVEPSKKREVFLKKVIPDKEAEQDSERRREETLDIEDFQAAQIWERHAAIAGLSEGSIMMSESATTWRQTVRWKYPDLFFASLRQQLTNITPYDGGVGAWRDKGPWQSLHAKGFILDLEILGEIGTKQSILIVQKPGSVSVAKSEILKNARAFWKAAQDFIKDNSPPEWLAEFHQPAGSKPEPTTSLTDKFGGLVRDLKWKRLLRSHAAQCLASRILPQERKRGAASRRLLSTFLFPNGEARSELESRLTAITSLSDALSVSILSGADFRLDRDSIKTSGPLSRLKSRLEYELTEVGHTLPVFLSLAYAATKEGKLENITSLFSANHAPESKEARDWPIQSEAYQPNDQERHIDCGTETAFSIPAIWRSWCREFAPDATGIAELGCLDHIELKQEVDDIRVILSSSTIGADNSQLSFLLVNNKADCKAFHRVLVHDTYGLDKYLMEKESPFQPQDTHSPPIWRKREDGTVPDECIEAKGVLDFLTFCRRRIKPDKSGELPSFCLLLAFVGGEWMLEQRSWLTDGKEYSPETGLALCGEYAALGFGKLIQSFERVARAKGASLPLGPEFGLTTHVFVPLCRSLEETSEVQDVGFAVFSGSQVEHDTIRRVDIRSAQKALVTFSTDYLEYAISQELQQVQQMNSLQQVAHSLSQMGGFHTGAATAAKGFLELPDVKKNKERIPEWADEFIASLERPQTSSAAGQSLHDFLGQCGFLFDVGVQSFLFSAVMDGLKQTLAGKPELQEYKVNARPDQAANLKTWVEFLCERIKTNEKGRFPNPTEFRFPRRNLAGAEVIQHIPFGSLCILFDELARNAGKHKRPGSRPRIILQFDRATECLNVVVSNVIRKDPTSDSTGGGRPIMATILRANFGDEALKHCNRVRIGSRVWRLHMQLNFRAYKNKLKPKAIV